MTESETTEVILAVNYMVEAFVQHYKATKPKPKIAFLRDIPVTNKRKLFQRPLGTGGAIKNAERLIGRKEPFLVLNGDILTNIDYAQLMKKHGIHNEATATIALHKVEDPSQYGVAELASDNHVIRFVEKPPREKTPSNLINAGIYILEPEIFDYVPKGRPVSIEREVFPKLAKEGKLLGYNFKGLWIDIGKPEDYLKANRLWLTQEIRENQIGKNIHLKPKVEIKKPSSIGNGTRIGENSTIGPHVTLGEHLTIGKKVQIKNSIIFSGTIIGDFASIKDATIGEAAMIGSHVKIESGCLIGDHAKIHDNVTLARGVSVCPYKEVTESVLIPKQCLM